MKYCTKCGKELIDEAVVCPGCGCAVVAPNSGHQGMPQYQNYQTEQYDKPNVGLCILSALIPLFGFIYWPVKHTESPKKAQACGITAITAFIIYMSFYLR